MSTDLVAAGAGLEAPELGAGEESEFDAGVPVAALDVTGALVVGGVVELDDGDEDPQAVVSNAATVRVRATCHFLLGMVVNLPSGFGMEFWSGNQCAAQSGRRNWRPQGAVSDTVGCGAWGG
jgi:hypothetical protein